MSTIYTVRFSSQSSMAWDPVVQLMLEKGANVNRHGYVFIRHTPLTYAAILNRPSIVRRLLDAGADTDLMTNDGLTALHVAAEGCYLEVVLVLLEKGANIEAVTQQRPGVLLPCTMKPPYPQTPLAIAAETSGPGSKSIHAA
ncbi:ankyrin repeat domain-containing protein [Aspergillus ibericus CBS 121593]|uniref:Ankyrin n=1 Tax=Aspergillus ibericus CBS 121593 TaxID=1448316 RepID=A0A395GJF2_9EURO|nr:ankyrin [Aspergillus ibericus CBS 121593]RAK95615.1 ankyrin [Aspergillus ibericus CBS 121593]